MRASGMCRKSAGAAGWLATALLLAMPAGSAAAGPHPRLCQRVVLSGEVSEGAEWRADLGEGWVFRVLPIVPGKDSYSGWDLVVDRARPAGYPDALLLATPPYNSINEREIGTTYGLRAQDAIGWNPRSFHFLTDPAALSEGQRLFLELSRMGQTRQGRESASLAALTRKLMALEGRAAAGELRIVDARLAPGLSDAAPFAQNWALRSARTPHTVAAARNPRTSAQGELQWMRFSITLWLPAGWQTPKGATAAPGPCQE